MFDVENLTLTASGDVALAHGFIRCDGTLQDGTALQDVVRATFRLKKAGGRWVIEHQHVSNPYEHS